MPKVTEAHRAARRDEILDAAQRVFAHGGYRGSSMADVIKASGLSAGAIYSYFAGKEELFRAVVDRTFALRTTVLAADAPAEPRSPSAVLAAVISSMEHQPILTIAPQVWAEAAVEPEIREAVGAVFTQVGEMLRAELSAWAALHPERTGDDPKAWAARVAPVIASMIPGYITQRQMAPDFDHDAYLGALADTFAC